MLPVKIKECLEKALTGGVRMVVALVMISLIIVFILILVVMRLIDVLQEAFTGLSSGGSNKD